MWRFYLNDLEVQQPIGFDGINFTISREERWHGIFIEASTTTLQFYGVAGNYLKDYFNDYGVDALVIFRAEIKCDGQEDYNTVIEGKLNFTNYKVTCGDDCRVSINIEQKTCAMTFKNRFNQKVDIDSSLAFDKLTNLVNYSGLDFTMPLATQEIPISADATGGNELTLTDIGFSTSVAPARTDLLIRPVYSIVNDNSINTGQLNDPFNDWQDPEQFFLLSPQVLVDEAPNCIQDEFEYNIRIKGGIEYEVVSQTGGTAQVRIQTYIILWDGSGTDIFTDGQILHSDVVQLFALPNTLYNYDYAHSGNIPVEVGMGVYAFVRINYSTAGGGGNSLVINVTNRFDAENSFYLYNVKECPPTDCQVYLVNETLARVTESITDRCLTIKSDYYGRTDSQPFESDVDGCGSLRVFTNGLKIRQAEEKRFFASMQELMDGLRAIDNIGMGFYEDNIRIEPAEWFYKDEEILRLESIAEIESEVEPNLIYSDIKCGYSKWEVKSTKGIDEFNSAKEFRTSIDSVNNSLDIRCNFVTSGYIIEDSRTKNLVNSGNTDTTYDNDVFLITVVRSGYSYLVEQGVVENADNLFSPQTAYNWRIRPIYNLMRWFKSIAQTYINLTNSQSKLFFASGTGNYLAEGNISIYDNCSLESRVMAENSDISVNDFKEVEQPIYRPIISKVETGLSIKDYERIKLNPYGYISVQCGNGIFEKHYIKTLKYNPIKFTAEFTLIKAW